MPGRPLIDRLRLRKVFGGTGERDPRFVFLFILAIIAVIAVALVTMLPLFVKAPVAVLTAPDEAVVEEQIEFDASDSTGYSFTYHWDFGDGSIHDSDAVVWHTYAEPGEYLVTLTVADPFGQSYTLEHTVVVKEP